MTTKTFQEYRDAREYIMQQGFNVAEEKSISMGYGYEAIFIFEYEHKWRNEVCRMADLRWSCYKEVPGQRLPNIIGFIQVSIKEKENVGQENTN